MFGGFFNRMYYGNPNKPDLKEEDVQEGRIKLFFTVLGVRFWKLIQLNLLYAIFWIPAFSVIYINNMAIAQVLAEGGTLGDIQGMIFTMLLILIPLITITGPGTAGATYVIRNWARDEHAWVWSHFKDAWKENWKESLIIALINALAILIFYVNMVFYSTSGSENLLFLVLRYLMIMVGIIFTMMNMFIFPMLVTYKLKIRQIYKNAFIFTMAELPRAFLVFISASLLFSVVFYFSIPFILPFFLIGLTFPMLITASFANWVFDKYLNRMLDDKGEIKPTDGP